ncbi:SAP domain-containing protein 1 [Elsinoe fawcettii]|nr:SAP domain-containing protein 1 [Elsinoe fawcettii]
MDSAHEVTDSSDWLQTTLPTFSQLENSLRCQVCKDFFTNPVITSCCHTFCSLCIRRCISSDGKCPACRQSDQASKLRQNHAIGEVVATFKAARPDALKLATERKQEEDDIATRPAKRRRTQKDEQPTPPSSQRQTRSRTKVQPSAPADVMVLDDDNEDGDYEDVKEPDDGLVACPICGGRMKEETVFPHIDTCDGTPPDRKKSSTPVNPLQQRPPARPLSQPQERIAELNYSMMTDAQMRKKLKDIGIPNTGNKQLMIRRHTEWANLWNSNCDSSYPRSKGQLLKELDVWEKSQGGQARPSHGSINGIMKKEFDAKAYSTSHSDDFTRLIQEAKRKARAKANPAATLAEENGTSNEHAAVTSGTSDNANEPKSTAKQLNGTADSTQPNEIISPGRPASSQSSQANGNDTSSRRVSDAGRSHIVESTAAPVPGNQGQALMSKARFGADAYPEHRRGSDGIGARFNTQPTRRVPMFALSSEPVADVDLGQGKP